ncbi:translation initiation factor IF-2-like [Motacilla alba alba]|uniref:translation initiation factor IF-2-like n=1 Tax=Motacilla alba alba TaxID=1094192 RepID=UPI0018D5281D|nr:translation initiation factor IF-2-like [Motacilla alba alba]
MGEPTPWHAGAPHLAGREGRRASRLRGAGPRRRGGRTVMSEEQVSRCHTHSGVAESTMCVSQWLTCSWRVTGGRRGPSAAQATLASAKDGAREGGAAPCPGSAARGAAAPRSHPRDRLARAAAGPAAPRSSGTGESLPARPPLTCAPAAAAAANFSLCPGPAHAARRGPLTPPPRAAPANRDAARPPAGSAPAPLQPMAKPPPPADGRGGAGPAGFQSPRRCQSHDVCSDGEVRSRMAGERHGLPSVPASVRCQRRCAAPMDSGRNPNGGTCPQSYPWRLASPA